MLGLPDGRKFLRAGLACAPPAPPPAGERGDPLRGPSVHYLSEVLLREAQAAGLSRDSTVHELEAALVRARGADEDCPRDGRRGSAFVDTLRGADHAGRATFMLSYTWGYTLGDIADALAVYCKRQGLDSRRTYVWICCLCINQHRVQEAKLRGEAVPFECFALEFSSRVRGIGHILALMGTWQAPKYITRAWCIYELYMAMQLDCKLDIIMPSRDADDFLRALIEDEEQLDVLWRALQMVDVRKAEASIAADKENILRLVGEGPGFNALNQKVRRKLQIWFAETAENEVQQVHQRKKARKYTCAQARQVGVKIGRMLLELNQVDRLLKVSRWWQSTLVGTECATSPTAAANWTNMGIAQSQQGDLEGARTSLTEALRIHEALGTLETADGAALYQLYGMHLGRQGDVAAGLEKLLEALRVLRATGTLRGSVLGATVLVGIGVFHTVLGHVDDARAHQQEALRILEATGRTATPCGAQLLATTAYVDMACGHVSEALGKCTRALIILEETGTVETTNGAHCLTLLGWVKAEMGDVNGAQGTCQEALRIHEACDSLETPEGLDCLVFLAYVKDRLGDAPAASRLRRQASGVRACQGSAPILRLAPPEFYA